VARLRAGRAALERRSRLRPAGRAGRARGGGLSAGDPAAGPRGARSRELTPARGLASDLSRAGVYGEIRPRARADFEAARWRAAARPPPSGAGGRPPPTRSRTSRSCCSTAAWTTGGGATSRSSAWAGRGPRHAAPGALREREPRARAAAVEALEARLAEETPFVPVARVREEAFYRRSCTRSASTRLRAGPRGGVAAP